MNFLGNLIIPPSESPTQSLSRATPPAATYSRPPAATLQAPCELLAQSEPKQIAAQLPHILNIIRCIWSHSHFYNTVDRVSGLLRKVSNEIIERCKNKVNLKDVWEGNVDVVMPILEQSIASGELWKVWSARPCFGGLFVCLFARLAVSVDLPHDGPLDQQAHREEVGVRRVAHLRADRRVRPALPRPARGVRVADPVQPEGE